MKRVTAAVVGLLMTIGALVGVVVPAGAVESQMGVAHSAAGYSGAYDVYVGRGVSERPGVLFYFDADSSSGRFRYLDSRLMGRVRDAAAQRDLVFVAVHTPGGKGKYGLWNWWDDRAKGAYGRDLVKTVVQRYGLDASRVWLSGWSGGAEVITKEILAQDTGWIGGGGMIVMGGGEAEFGVQSPGGGAAGMKLRWFVGDRDGYGATIPKDWSARVAAERGVASYRAAGFRDTRLVVLPNQNHFYDVAAVIKKGLTEAKAPAPAPSPTASVKPTAAPPSASPVPSKTPTEAPPAPAPSPTVTVSTPVVTASAPAVQTPAPSASEVQALPRTGAGSSAVLVAICSVLLAASGWLWWRKRTAQQ